MKMGIWIALVLIVVVIVLIEVKKPEVGNFTKTEVGLSNAEKEMKYPKAIELVEPDGYLNTEYINISSLIGKKIILVDFWTYSCINCQRTLPYLNDWYSKYSVDLEIVGVHTPEFGFEEEYDNVAAAIAKYGIKYPVVQDNEYKTWRAYSNRYWPRKYLIDIDGYIVYDHIGEGDYAETELKIQELIKEKNNKSVDMKLSSFEEHKSLGKKTAEIYFGYDFSRNQFGQEWIAGKTVDYKYPAVFEEDKFYLEGKFKNEADHMALIGDGKVELKFTAKDVYLVAGGKGTVDVFVDGEMVKTITVDHNDLYTLYNGEKNGAHQLELRGKDVEFYTFTFG